MEPLGERPELEAQPGRPPQSPAVVPLNLSSRHFGDRLSPLCELCPRLDSENTGSGIVLALGNSLFGGNQTSMHTRVIFF